MSNITIPENKNSYNPTMMLPLHCIVLRKNKVVKLFAPFSIILCLWKYSSLSFLSICLFIKSGQFRDLNWDCIGPIRYLNWDCIGPIRDLNLDCIGPIRYLNWDCILYRSN